jgi:hypothetical protein
MLAAIAVLAARLGRIPLALVLATALTVQVLDILPLIEKLQAKLEHKAGWEVPLRSGFWKQAAQHYREILFVPQVHMDPKDQPFFGPFALLAANHGMAINVGYFARVPLQALQSSADRLLSDFNEGKLDPDALYVIHDKGLSEGSKLVLHDTDGIGEIDGFTVIAPG